MLNFSLDTSREDWLKACREDSKQWMETCDFKGWDNQLVRQNSVARLPANLLIDHSRRILGTGLHGEALKAKLKELIK